MRRSGALIVCLLGVAAAATAETSIPVEVSVITLPVPGGQVSRLFVGLNPAAEALAEPVRVTAAVRDRSGTSVLDAGWTAEPGDWSPGTVWHRSAPLPPGEVRVELVVHALGAGSIREQNQSLRIPDGFKGEFPASDLIPGRLDPPGPFITPDGLTPHPNGRLEAPDSLSGALLVAVVPPRQPLEVRWKLTDGRATQREGRLTVQADSLGVAAARWPLPLAGLASGAYTLEAEARSAGDTVKRKAPVQLRFGAGVQIADPVKARTVLAYIATNAERRALEETWDRDLPGFWSAFWERRDTTPGSPGNAAEDEFMARVDYAERHLGGSVPGWQTDRSRIHILYGEADRYENTFTDYGVPSQIWYYYDRHEVFVFEDRTGFGDYTLAGSERR